MTRNARSGRRDQPASPAPPDAPDAQDASLAKSEDLPEDLPEDLRAWMVPVPGRCPAGPCLEYTTEYAALQARMAAPVEVQYGPFTQRREPPPWRELERECQALLERSRDITVLVWWLRCRVHNAGAPGLEQGLRTMVRVLRAFGEQVHPQARIDGEHDPAMRANALALLCDADGLLADVRDLVALRAQGEHRRVRDIERELAVSAASRRALQAVLARSWFDADPDRRALGAAHEALASLLAWAREDLGAAGPDLRALEGLLESLAPPSASGAEDAASLAEGSGGAVAATVPEFAGEPAPSTGAERIRQPGAGLLGDAIPCCADAPDPPQDAAASCKLARWRAADRAAVQASIAQARAWFECYEPSSPVAVLLRQAERLVGKRYAEVVQAIPGELLARWESG